MPTSSIRPRVSSFAPFPQIERPVAHIPWRFQHGSIASGQLRRQQARLFGRKKSCSAAQAAGISVFSYR
jgi:hypothetical protein